MKREQRVIHAQRSPKLAINRRKKTSVGGYLNINLNTRIKKRQRHHAYFNGDGALCPIIYIMVMGYKRAVPIEHIIIQKEPVDPSPEASLKPARGHLSPHHPITAQKSCSNFLGSHLYTKGFFFFLKSSYPLLFFGGVPIIIQANIYDMTTYKIIEQKY